MRPFTEAKRPASAAFKSEWLEVCWDKSESQKQNEKYHMSKFKFLLQVSLVWIKGTFEIICSLMVVKNYSKSQSNSG